MGFEFAQVIAELGKGVVFWGELEGGEDGLVDLTGAPSAELGAAVEQDVQETEHTGVMDLMPGILVFPEGMGKARRWNRGKSTCTSRAWASKAAKRWVTAARV